MEKNPSSILFRPIQLTMHSHITGGSCHKYHSCCNKSFVTTNTCLSQQNIVFCHDKTFVTTKLCLSRQNIFVATKMILVAAPASDTPWWMDPYWHNPSPSTTLLWILQANWREINVNANVYRINTETHLNNIYKVFSCAWEMAVAVSACERFKRKYFLNMQRRKIIKKITNYNSSFRTFMWNIL